jgi:hypothetical protein
MDNPKILYSLSDLQRLLGVPRQRLSGMIFALQIPVYAGMNNAKCVDEDGLAALRKASENRAAMMAAV